jgi:hypothetical protein
VFCEIAEEQHTEKMAIRFGAVNCAAFNGLCRQNHVEGYPTVKAFGFQDVGNGTSLSSRTKEAINKWIRERVSAHGGAQGTNEAHENPWLGAEGIATPTKDSPLKRVNDERVLRHRDAMTALQFAFDKEVFLGVETLGTDSLMHLKSFLRLLALSLPGRDYRKRFTELYDDVKDRMSLTVDEWSGTMKRLNPTMLSEAPLHWELCPGYTCGLWTLFHILSVQSGFQGTSPVVTMEAVRGFVESFFGCAACRSHFLDSYENCRHGRCDITESDVDNRALVLWLWRLHNAVNLRVGMEAGGTAGRTRGNYTELLWPSVSACPACWDHTAHEDYELPGDAFSEEIVQAYVDLASDQNKVYQHLLYNYKLPDPVGSGGVKELEIYPTVGQGYILIGLFMCISLFFWCRWRHKLTSGRHKKVDRGAAARTNALV